MSFKEKAQVPSFKLIKPPTAKVCYKVLSRLQHNEHQKHKINKKIACRCRSLLAKPPKKTQHMYDGATCCLEGSRLLQPRLGGPVRTTISNVKEGSLPSRPGSKDAEPSNIGYAPLSNGECTPQAQPGQKPDTPH